MSDNALRLPPQNLDAERGAIGSILLMNEAIDEISDTLKSEHFYSDAHQKIYAAILSLHGRGVRGIDGITLSEELVSCGEFEAIGGAAYLAEVLEAVPHAAHVRYYAGIVREKWVQRSLIYAGSQIAADCFDNPDDIDTLIHTAEQRIAAIAEDRVTSDITSIGFLNMEALERIDQRMKTEKQVTGITTGFADLDSMTTGFQRSELTILAARPSMGKTAIAIRMAHAAAKSGAGVLIFSLEQKPIDISERMLTQIACVNGHNIRSGSLTESDLRKISAAAAQLDPLQIQVDLAPQRTVTQIVAIARRENRKKRLGLIVIDYLQLITPDDKRAPREQQIAGISRSLKILARELNIPIVALAQLNREVENRENKRPKLADLRESGAIEQDADLVLMLHRPDAFDAEDRPGLAEIVIAKNRSGPTGIVALTWRKEFLRFEDRAAESTLDWLEGSKL
jgi:replicative DNA helicase